MRGPARAGGLVDRGLLIRAFGVLGPTEAAMSMTAFVAVLLAGGWEWGQPPAPALLATASGTTFAVIAVAQMANALACRSATHPVWKLPFLGNPLLLAAVAAEAVLLLAFLGLPFMARLLGGSWPDLQGWCFAFAAAPVLLLVDAAHKAWRRGRGRDRGGDGESGRSGRDRGVPRAG